VRAEAGSSSPCRSHALSECPACGAAGAEVFYEQRNVPVQSVALLRTAEEARAFPRGDLELAFCDPCGFVFNRAFDSGLQDYSRPSEESQAFSPRFQAFSEELAAGLVDRYDVRGKDVIEAGSGRGDFLIEICELGGNRGVGIDPGWQPGRLDAPPSVAFVRAPFDDEQADREADLVLCRHTLEHISPVREFVARLARPAEPRQGVVLIEVPDVLRVLREAAFWDVYYEHCSYFAPDSLAGLARRCGLDVLDNRLVFGEQYLVLEARSSVPSNSLLQEGDGRELRRAVEHFADDAPRAIDRWRGLLGGRGRVALWGGSSKAVAFLTAVGADADVAVVDINPYRQGAFLPGAGQRVLAPDELRRRPPDLVVAMNPAYLDEIASALDELGLSCELAAAG
jgi:methyltransferase family protein/C-methyltransferase-like protein